MSFAEFYQGVSGIGDAYDAGLKKSSLAALGTQLQAGNYDGAAKIAFDSGDPDTGLKLLGMGQTAKATPAFSQLLNQYGAAGGLGGAGAPVAPSPASGPSAPVAPTARTSSIDPASIPSFIKSAAENNGVSPTYLAGTAQIESKGDPNAFNKGSGASGLFQFVPGTAARYGLTDPFDPQASANAAARLAADNAAVLRSKLGRDPTDGELYLAHQQGAGGAAALLAHPDAPAIDALAQAYGGDRNKAARAIASNGGDPNAPAGVFASKWTSKFAGGPGMVALPTTSQTASSPAASPQVAQVTPSVPAPQSGLTPIPADMADAGAASAPQQSPQVSQAGSSSPAPTDAHGLDPAALARIQLAAKYNPGTPANRVVGPAYVQSNPDLYTGPDGQPLTVGQVAARIAGTAPAQAAQQVAQVLPPPRPVGIGDAPVGAPVQVASADPSFAPQTRPTPEQAAATGMSPGAYLGTPPQQPRGQPFPLTPGSQAAAQSAPAASVPPQQPPAQQPIPGVATSGLTPLSQQVPQIVAQERAAGVPSSLPPGVAQQQVASGMVPAGPQGAPPTAVQPQGASQAGAPAPYVPKPAPGMQDLSGDFPVLMPDGKYWTVAKAAATEDDASPNDTDVAAAQKAVRARADAPAASSTGGPAPQSDPAAVSAAAPAAIANAGLPPAAATQFQNGDSQKRIRILMNMAMIPGLNEQQSGVIKTLLSNELDQSKMPDSVKQYMFARAQDPSVGTYTQWTDRNQKADTDKSETSDIKNYKFYAQQETAAGRTPLPFNSYETQTRDRASGPKIVYPGAALVGPDGKEVYRNQGGGASGMNDQTADFLAERVLAGDTKALVGLGRGAQGAETLTKVQNLVAQKAQERGIDASDILHSVAVAQGQGAQERTLGTQTARMAAASTEAEGAIALGRVASAAVPRTSFVPLNRAIQTIQSGTSSPELKSFVAANNTIINTFARAINPNGAPTMSDKEHARDMLSTADGPEAYNAVLDQLQKEIDLAHGAPPRARQMLESQRQQAKPGAASVAPPPQQPVSGQGSPPPTAAPVIPEGATATNPRTNVRIIYKGGAWVPFQ